MHLLVFPDPHQCLMEQRPDLLSHRELCDPAGHRFLSVCHGHDLLPLQGEEKELLAFSGRVARALGRPAVQLSLDVPQQIRLE
jgi:hypothetical protein